jgi:FkbH-like protein
MSFLSATRALREFAGGPEWRVLFGMSGTADPFLLYLRAAAAQRGRSAHVRTLPFNTLPQALLDPPRDGEQEVFILLPWDLAPELDWRSGVPAAGVDPDAILARAEAMMTTLATRRATLVYLAAPLPPLALDVDANRAFAHRLEGMALAAGAYRLAPDSFSLAAYLASGCPASGGAVEAIAEAVVARALDPAPESAKVLVTDLDATLWAGVIGDDGVDGIRCGPEGEGYPHFVFQSMCRRLRMDGVLLAAVTKNEPATAVAPFRAGVTALGEDDFVAILASWHAKSAQIRTLAEQLNLGLDAFVFVDDNPVELAEVAAALPGVRCVPFPPTVAELPHLLDRVAGHFRRGVVTAEDRERTALYRRRLAGMAPTEAAGADLTGFLRALEMRLTVHDRSTGDRTRAVQLINKTNQFNANGRRWAEDEVAAVLAGGGRLITATLDDRTGSHGEILAALVESSGEIGAMVMSCRVFQRRVEHAFLAWLLETSAAPTAIRYAGTPKNGPLQTFLAEWLGVSPADGTVHLPNDAAARLRAAAEVVQVVPPAIVGAG